MKALHDPINLRTTDQMLKIYHVSRQTLRRRRNEALGTKFENSFFRDGTKYYYDIDMWQQYLEWRDRKHKEELYGLTDLRNSRQLA